MTITLNVLYAKKEKIYPSDVSKHISNREKKSYFFDVSKFQVIPKSEGRWHYLAVKNYQHY